VSTLTAVALLALCGLLATVFLLTIRGSPWWTWVKVLAGCLVVALFVVVPINVVLILVEYRRLYSLLCPS
jgi:hypothetical protein